jgi:hypothetical protein
MNDLSKYEELAITRLEKACISNWSKPSHVFFAFNNDLRVLLHSYTTA